MNKPFNYLIVDYIFFENAIPYSISLTFVILIAGSESTPMMGRSPVKTQTAPEWTSERPRGPYGKMQSFSVRRPDIL